MPHDRQKLSDIDILKRTKMLWKTVSVMGLIGVLFGLAITGTLIARLIMTEETVGLVFVIKNRKS